MNKKQPPKTIPNDALVTATGGAWIYAGPGPGPGYGPGPGWGPPPPPAWGYGYDRWYRRW